MSELGGRTVLVTGAARGIGAATARALRARGARLVLVDVDAEALAALAGDLGDTDVVAAPGDVRDLGSLHDAVAQAERAFGGLDVVLANAGVASYGSMLAVDPEEFRRVLDVNVLGVFHTLRAALPAVAARRGYVLVVSSLAAFAAVPGLAAYAASKAGVEHLADVVRLEVAHRGVDVGTAHMSWVETPLVADARADLGSFPELLARLPGPLSRTMSAEACAEAFVRAMERRRRRVYVPSWVALLALLRGPLGTAAAHRRVLADVPRLLDRIDTETARLGRSTSARNLVGDPLPRGSERP